MNRHDLDVRQLRALLAVVEHGTLSRAAAALQVAQSTMSEAMACLDRAVGTRVLARRRGGHRLELTEAGRALLPHARNVVRELQDAQRAVARVTSHAHSRVTVFTVESLSTYVLPGVLAATRKRWPNTRFAVTVAPCDRIRPAAQEGLCDLGLMLEERPEGLSPPRAPADTEFVGEVPLVFFCAPSHALLHQARHRPLRLDVLTQSTVFLSDGAGAYHDMLVRYLSMGRLPTPRVEASGSVEATRNAVLADPTVVGILPAYAVALLLRSGRARVLGVAPPPPTMRINAWLPRDGAPHPAALTLIEHARQAFDSQNPGTLPASA